VPCATPTLMAEELNQVLRDIEKLREGCAKCCPQICDRVWECRKALEVCNAPGRRGRKPEGCKECEELWDKYSEACQKCVKDCPPECENLRAVVVGYLARAAVAYASDIEALIAAKNVEGAYELLQGKVWAAVVSRAVRDWLTEVRKAPLMAGRYYPPPECCRAALALSYMVGALVRDPKAHGLLNAIKAEAVAGVCTVPVESTWAAEALLAYIFATAAP